MTKLTLHVVFLLLTFSALSGPTMSSRTGVFYSRTRGTCTPQYWSRKKEEWPRMVPQESTVSKVFGSRALERYRSDMTVAEATARSEEEDVYGWLLKEGSAALLNSYARKGFPYSAWEVKSLVIEALVSKQAAFKQAKHFFVANEGCN